jgi:phenylalanyl-tRNA synthetase beta chain
MIEILEPLGFSVRHEDDELRVVVPSWRATKDVTIEADVIEEIARYVGYNNIEPVLPENELRSFDLNAQHALEQHTLRLLCEGLSFNEIHDYIWYDAAWIRKLGFDPGPCIELRNPAAAGMEMLRQTLMPGLLASVERNRHHFDDFKLAELGGVFMPGDGESDRHEHRHLALVIARRQKGREDEILAELKGVIEVWTAQALRRGVEFRSTEKDTARPWEHPQKTAGIRIANMEVGKASVLPLGLRLTMDEHLKPWSIAWAELQLDALPGLAAPEEKLQSVAAHPEVELDFSFLVDLTQHFSAATEQLRSFDHPLLHRITYVGSYEGKSVPDGKRSLTVRCRIGDATRTLVDEDIASFRSSFEAHLERCGWPLRC